MTKIARHIAAPPPGETMLALTLELGGEIFAIEATRVREILDMVPITEVPNAPAFLGGLINVRGRVVPLADLRVRFCMERPPPDAETRIVVIEIALDGEPTIVGLLADRVHTVADIDLLTLEDAPSVGMRWRQDYVQGIARHNEQFIILPELGRIFSNDGAKGAAPEVEERA
ncbi:chemotaxis protein CheW [Phaeovulum sp.]|uniref:chemotaxis protein CheW n=1 Tax=Phaeovulum sp. TaxID=2934796 RepID=UPI0035682DBD